MIFVSKSIDTSLQTSVEEIDVSAGKGLPVYKASVGDDHAVVILEDGVMYVPSVWAPGDAGLSGVMDHAVRTFKPDTVKFTSVISSELGDALDGFEVEYETHPAGGYRVKCLTGTWEVDR